MCQAWYMHAEDTEEPKQSRLPPVLDLVYWVGGGSSMPPFSTDDDPENRRVSGVTKVTGCRELLLGERTAYLKPGR